jgi:chorismate-pyruvate lyase
MAEELKIGKMLKMLEGAPNLTALQRAIVTTDGTVQTMLSVIFGKEVTAKVISQLDIGGVTVRWTQLIIEETGQVVCIAESIIPRGANSRVFMEDLDAREIGIGQILAKHKIMTKRTLLGIFCDNENFTRTYRIAGSTTDILITEVFPFRVYAEVS